MNWQTMNFDWNQVRAFLATAEEGSLSAAARALGQTQPTLSRQVSALEDDLGVVLFERGNRAMALTQTGLELLDHVRDMGDAASRISLSAAGQSQAIEGLVRISATDMVAAHFLPDILVRLRKIAPGIDIVVDATSSVSDLTRREADIAIRHVRPEQPSLIARLIHESTGHLYAASDYLDRFGRPATAKDLTNADFVGFQEPDRLIPVLNALGLSLTRTNFRLTTNSGVAMLEMIRQGLGIGIMPRDFAALLDGIECVLPDLPPVPVQTWLVTHSELHTSRRIRTVFDFLADELIPKGS